MIGAVLSWLGPWTYAVVAVAAAGATWRIEEWRFAAARSEQERAILADTFRRVEREDRKAEIHEVQKRVLVTKFLPITETVEKLVQTPFYRDVCLDDDGMRVIARAIAASPTASEPARAVPGPTDAGGRKP